MKRREESLHDLGDPMKWTNVRIIGFPGEKRERGRKFKEIIAENFPIILLYR